MQVILEFMNVSIKSGKQQSPTVTINQTPVASTRPPRPNHSEKASEKLEESFRKRRPSLHIRLAQDTEWDWQASFRLAREAHQNTIFNAIPISETKVRAIFDRAITQPDRFGLIYALSEPLETQDDNGLCGFASVHAGEYFLGEGALIATVQTLNISGKLEGTLLAGKVAVRLMQAIRHWAQTRDCQYLITHVTNGHDPARADRFFRKCGMKTAGGNYFTAL